MKHLKTILSFASLVLLVSSAPTLAEYRVLNEELLDRASRWDFIVGGNNDLWLGYYSKDNLQLRLRNPQGAESRVGFTDRTQAPAGLELAVDDMGPVLLWRDKLPRKNIYVLRPDHEPQGIAENTEALPRIRFTRFGDKEIYLWYGELFDEETKSPYNIYVRMADRGGSNLGPIHKVMPGIYPLWLQDDAGIAIFSVINKADTQLLAFRTFDPAKGELGDITEAGTIPRTGPTINLMTSGKRWLAIWKNLDHDDRPLEGIYSDDRGLTWKQLSFHALNGVGLDVAKITTAADEKGHILLTVSGGNRSGDYKAPHNVYVTQSSDRGDSWSPPVRMGDPKGPDIFNARNPSIAFGNTPGDAMLVWEDWRGLRGAVYATRSQDWGKTWGTETRLTTLDKNYTLPFEQAALRARNDSFVIVAERYRDDSMKLLDLVEISPTLDGLTPEGGTGSAPPTEAATSPDRVRERVTAYWQSFVNGDYATAYSFLDPYFRSAISLNRYLQQMGRVKYHSFKLGDIHVEGNIATVAVTIEASVPPFKVAGETVSREKEEMSFTETWLWIDREWQREYFEKSTNNRWTRY